MLAKTVEIVPEVVKFEDNCAQILFSNVGILFVSGLDRLYKDIELMIGYKPCRWWKITWGFITPIIILVRTFTTMQK